MRIPLSKVYRAFPELDRFSDAECEGFMRLASLQYEGSRLFLGVTNVMLWIVVCVVCVVLTGEAVWAARGTGMGDALEHADWIVLAGSGLSILIPSLLVMWRHDRWLKRALVVRLREVKCAECSYVLLGLEVVQDGITCPECGQRFLLTPRGLTPADVLAKRPAPTE